MYRMHIDIPMEGLSLEESKSVSELLTGIIWNSNTALRDRGITTVNIRLGNDQDRQKSNYLDFNENGHVTNKKRKITL